MSNKHTNENGYHSTGIWTHASLINHSCVSTARRSFIGDMMIVRASRNLEPGTEVTFWYYPPTGRTFKEQKEKLQNWGFECDCPLCVDGKDTTGTLASARQQLRGTIKKLINGTAPHRLDTEKISRRTAILEKQYKRPATELPRLLIWDSQLALSQAYLAQNQISKGLEALKKMFISLGFKVVGMDSTSNRYAVVEWGFFVDALVEAFLLASDIFTGLARNEDSKQAKEYAKVAYKIVVGEDTSFEATYM